MFPVSDRRTSPLAVAVVWFVVLAGPFLAAPNETAVQAAPEVLEDGRFVATFSSGADVQRLSGVAWIDTPVGDRRNVLLLCPQPADPRYPGAIYFSIPGDAASLEGEHTLGRDRVALTVRPVVTGVPGGVRTTSDLLPGSSVTIASASDQVVAGAWQAHYKDGTFSGQFRAQVGRPAEFRGARQCQRSRALPGSG